MPDSKTLIVMPAPLVEAANEVARQMQRVIDGTDNGIRTLTVQLHPKDAPDDTTPSHYWCAVSMREDIRAEADVAIAQFPGAVMLDYDPINDPGFPHRWLSENNLRTALPQMMGQS
jgi:hypothetical protein